MTITNDRIHVSIGECACHTVPTAHVSHRDFPEIRAEGGTVEEAARRLVLMLRSASDSVGNPRRRAAITRAVEDVLACLEENP